MYLIVAADGGYERPSADDPPTGESAAPTGPEAPGGNDDTLTAESAAT